MKGYAAIVGDVAGTTIDLADFWSSIKDAHLLPFNTWTSGI